MENRLSLKAQSSLMDSSYKKPGPKFKSKVFHYDRSLRSQVDTPTLSQIPDEILGLFAFSAKQDPASHKKIFQNNVNSLTETLKDKDFKKENLVAHLRDIPQTQSSETFLYESFTKNITLSGLRPRDRDMKVFLVIMDQIIKRLATGSMPPTIPVSDIIKESVVKTTTSDNKRNLIALISLSHIQASSQGRKDTNTKEQLKPLFTLTSDLTDKSEILGSLGQLKLSKILKTLHVSFKGSFLKDLIQARLRLSKDVPPIYERQGHYKPWKQKSYLSGQSFVIPHPVKSNVSMPVIRLMALLDAHRPMTEEVLFSPKQRTYSLNAMAHIAGRKGDLKDTKHRDRFLNLLQDVSKTTFDLSCEGDKVTMSPEANLLERLTVFHGFSPETLDTLKSESQKISSPHENYQALNLDLDQKITDFKSSISGEDSSQKSSISGEDSSQKSSISGEDSSESNCYNLENRSLSLYNKSLYILSVYKRERDRLTKEVLRSFQNLLSLPQKRIFEQALKYFKINIWEYGELTCKSKFMGLIRPIVERFACDMINYCHDNGILLDKMRLQQPETRPVSVVQTSKLSSLEALYRELQADDSPQTLEKSLVKSALSQQSSDTDSTLEVNSLETYEALKEADTIHNPFIKHNFSDSQGEPARALRDQSMYELRAKAIEKIERKVEKRLSEESHRVQKTQAYVVQMVDNKDENKKMVIKVLRQTAHKPFETLMKNKLLETINSYVKESHRERVTDFLGSQNHIQLKLFEKNLEDMRTDSLMRGYLKRSLNLSFDALIFKKTGSYGGNRA